MAADRPGLLDAVVAATDNAHCRCTSCQVSARAAVEAVAAWLDEHAAPLVAARLRAEVAPPPPPTPEDVIRKWLTESVSSVPAPGQGANAARLATALRDAGLLREDTP